jgi:hypothetical protein
MKKILIFTMTIITLGVSSCKKTETCSTYTKDTKVIKADNTAENI